MALNLQNKKAIVSEVSSLAKDSISLVVADYRGLSVGEMNKFRVQARSQGVNLRVIRNTLAKRAFEGSDCECLNDHLQGTLIFGFSKTEPSSAAKVFKSFAKTNPKLEIKALSLAGKYFLAKDIEMVASLPSRQEALQQLACTMLSPLKSLLRLVGEPGTSLARAIKAAGETKEA